jgi:hypothetical protein
VVSRSRIVGGRLCRACREKGRGGWWLVVGRLGGDEDEEEAAWLRGWQDGRWSWSW